MSCCGQKRQAWREATALTIAEIPRPRAAIQNPRVVYHLGASSLVVTGAVTGTVYLFAGHGAELAVDERDLQGLLAMKYFKC
jgi:hypothetical protein